MCLTKLSFALKLEKLLKQKNKVSSNHLFDGHVDAAEEKNYGKLRYISKQADSSF